MGRESNLQSSVLEYLNKLPGCVAENVSGDSHQSGRPDINGCYKGRMFKIELKTPDDKNTTSLKQNLELRRWKRAGCVVGVIYSMNALRWMFRQDWTTLYGMSLCLAEANGCTSQFSVPKTGR